MKTILILASGKVYTFYVKSLAVQYQQAYGGTLITTDLVNQQQPKSTLAI
jgi:hypothetical protein